MEKYKESTARIVLFREFGILNSFTLENSFMSKIALPAPEEEAKSDPGKVSEPPDSNLEVLKLQLPSIPPI